MDAVYAKMSPNAMNAFPRPISILKIPALNVMCVTNSVTSVPWRINAPNACQIVHISKLENARSALSSTKDARNALEPTNAVSVYQPPFTLMPRSAISARIIFRTAKLASTKQAASLAWKTTTL